jgi:hypothetical protein
MPDRFSARTGARNVAVAGVALFVVVLALLATQMASGHDPALGAGKPAKAVKRVAARPQPVQPSYDEPAYDDGSGYADDSGYSDGGSAQQQYAPQQQFKAPLQSSTS